MHVRACKLQDVNYGSRWFDEVKDHWEYDDLRGDLSWRKGWISIDCVLYDEQDSRVYLGITSFDADILRAYGRGSGEFVDLGYDRIADPFDVSSTVPW